MPGSTLDIVLVCLAVAAATLYLLRRKLRLLRPTDRDWSTGRAESCSSCPVVEIRKVQLEKKLPAR